MRNVIYWIGVVPEDDRVTKRFRYGDFSWMEYSKKTWQYWCEKNDVEFVHYDKPQRDDLMKYKVSWQRWLDVYDYIGEDYDSFMLVDGSIMVKWDAPNYFEVTKDGHAGVAIADENWGWTHKSAKGYEHLFPEVDFNHSLYVSAGMTLFRKEQEEMVRDFGKFYLDNHEEILRLEDEVVKRGTDQPVMNYFQQKYKIDRDYWSIDLAVNHLYRRQILNHNWQLDEDKTPFFIKYFNLWAFSGFPDRGETRLRLMSQTWDLIKHHYE